MNIFALDPSPTISAQYHCDQHLSKMILESAQMLSTAAAKFFPHAPAGIFYKPAYPHHPCTIWCCDSIIHCIWVCRLCEQLEHQRLIQGMNFHSSMEIIKAFKDYSYEIVDTIYSPTYFAVAMPAFIKIRRDLTPHQKYQLYYRFKHQQWKLHNERKNKHGMTYKNRPIPEFMSDLVKA